MLQSKVARTLGAIIVASLFAALTIGGCGDTGGGSAVEDGAGLGTNYVSDGGAGATLTIDVKGDLAVANTVGFSVVLTDPRGAPLSYVRVFCETEHGIAILEPSKGGYAFEHTDASGQMSGLLGGVSAGSYVIECRAPLEYNVIGRETIVITGTPPEGFTGFPGAAGGNLGGGRITVPDVDSGGVRITSITYQDVVAGGGGVEDTLYIDTYYTTDCDPTEAGNQGEPFVVNTYKLQIANETQETVYVNEVNVEIGDGRGIEMSQNIAYEIAPHDTIEVAGQLTDRAPKIYAGTSYVVLDGTFPIEFTVEGTAADGLDSFSITESQSVTFTGINNCGE